MAEAQDAVLPATALPAERISLLAPLRVRNFRYLWLGQTVSLVGDQFKFVALSWLVLSLTGRSGALGTVLMLQAIPRSILMLAGGVVTDRLRPRTVMVLSDVLRAVVVGTIALLAWTDRITMPHLYGLALVFGTVHAFFFPAASAIVPDLVPADHLRPANAVNQMTNQVVLAGAPALAGVVIAAVGTAGGFAVDAASFLISAVFLFLIVTAPRATRHDGGGAWQEFLAGLRVVRRDPILLALVATASVFFFGYAGATYVGLPVLAKGPLAAGPMGLGIFFSASGLGALLGGLLAGTRTIRRRGLVGMSVIAAVGVLLATVALARTVVQVAAVLFASGALMAWIGVTFMTLIQQRTDRAYMGRVMAILLFGIYGLYPFSYGIAGWVSEAVGVRALFVLGGGLIAAAGVLGAGVRDLRMLD